MIWWLVLSLLNRFITSGAIDNIPALLKGGDELDTKVLDIKSLIIWFIILRSNGFDI